MKILLDTHILIWFHSKDSELSDKAWKTLLDRENEIYFSSINVWETQIKHIKHSNEINFSGEELYEMSKKAGLKCLDVKSEHCIELKTLVYDESAPRQATSTGAKALRKSTGSSTQSTRSRQRKWSSLKARCGRCKGNALGIAF